MGRHDWYRCTAWTDEEREQFYQKIKRSRGNFHKAQYGRIQALYLEQTKNEELVREAVKLLESVETEWYDDSQKHRVITN